MDRRDNPKRLAQVITGYVAGIEAPTDDKVARRPQCAETGRKAWAAVGQERSSRGPLGLRQRPRDGAHAFDEKLRQRAERAVLRGNDRDRVPRMGIVPAAP